MNLSFLTRGLLALVAVCILAGCSEINLSIKINPDQSASFVEWFMLDQGLSSYFDMSRVPGDDFWSHLTRIAKSHGWTYKQRAVNELVVSGRVEKGKLLELEDQLIEELSSLALDYGAKPLLLGPPGELLPRTYKVSVQEALFSRIYSISYDVDLSTAALEEHLILPSDWKALMASHSDDQMAINLSVTTPMPVLKSNGSIGPSANTANWKIFVGQHNKLQVSYEIIEWNRVVLVALAVILLAGAGLVFWRRNKHATTSGAAAK